MERKKLNQVKIVEHNKISKTNKARKHLYKNNKFIDKDASDLPEVGATVDFKIRNSGTEWVIKSGKVIEKFGRVCMIEYEGSRTYAKLYDKKLGLLWEAGPTKLTP
jgi:hypothetical protein